MGALPQPHLAPGPHRELVEALHRLHHSAGWPSLRRLAADTGVSHTTVSKVLSSPVVPSWGSVELIVEAMGGDVARFHALWLGATAPAVPSERPSVEMAGRRAELAVVREHLVTGTGLLLVAGEAGIGKTTLVRAAAATSDTTVAVGHCLNLSREVPLLPVIEALRALQDVDGGRWVDEAVAECPAYVRQSLTRLLPELDPAATGVPEDRGGLERILSAVSSILRTLAATRPLALHVEDCHWADRSTLDVLTHLASTSTAVPLVATWRTDDPDVRSDHSDWLSRSRWMAGVATLDLEPLTLEETADQLVLCTGGRPDPAEAERIHARTRGLPLYTSQLAGAPPDGELPRHLADLLDRRIGDLDAGAWAVARVLGLAQRPAGPRLLQAASGMTPEGIDDALRVLARRGLTQTRAGHTELAHPLFAEAVDRRLLPGERAGVHALLAEALTDATDIEPGEIADHWRSADRPDQEIAHRVAAARRADERFAWREALSAWLRVLELWDSGERVDGLELWDVLVRALEASGQVYDVDARRMLARRAQALDLPDDRRAVALRWMAQCQTDDGMADEALALLDEALELLEGRPPSRDLAELLARRISVFIDVGRIHDAQDELRRGLAVCEALGDWRSRDWSALSAWVTMCSGDVDGAVATARDALASRWPDLDPVGDVNLACSATDIMIHAATPAREVEEAARDTLQQIEAYDLTHSDGGVVLRANLAWAYLNEGDVAAAREWLRPVTRSDPHDPDTASVHVLLAVIELREGSVQAALDRCRVAAAQVRFQGYNWADCVPWHAEVELWARRYGSALELLDDALRVTLPSDTLVTAVVVMLHARAHADRLDAEGDRATRSERRRLVQQLYAGVAAASVDPFAGALRDASVPAVERSWRAEMSRIDGTETVDLWVSAAAAWDRIVRPHEAAYCRWRGAQVALRDGQGTVAARLLGRAAIDSHTHVPLRQAIAATRGGV